MFVFYLKCKDTNTGDRFSDDSAETRYCQSHEQCCSYNWDLDGNEDIPDEKTTIHRCGYRQNRNQDIIRKITGERPAIYGKIILFT